MLRYDPILFPSNKKFLYYLHKKAPERIATARSFLLGFKNNAA